MQCSRIRILRFLRLKKHDFLGFFEMTFQKNVKVTKSITLAECLYKFWPQNL